jgi:hypothetical protein
MSTSYDSIFQKFMHEVSDFDLSYMHEEDMKTENKLTLSKAVSLFTKCKVDLTRNDTSETFSNTLPENIQWILADYMRQVWLEQKEANGELMKLHLNDRDYKIAFSPSNLLETIENLRIRYDKELRLRINDYLYSGYDYNNFRRDGV